MNRFVSLGLVAMLVAPATSAAAQSVTELYVRPDTLKLAPGARQSIAVQAFDDAGNAVLSFTFKSSDTEVATVAANGGVTAGKAGRAQITVTAGSKSQSIPVIVGGGAPAPVAAAKPAAKPATPAVRPSAKPAIARLSAEPSSLTLFLGQRTPVVIRGFDAAGAPVDVPAVIYRPQQPGLVSVNDATGEVTGLAPGSGAIRATAGNNINLMIPFTVEDGGYVLSDQRLLLAPEQRDTLRATLQGQGNRPVPPGVLQWSVADRGVVEVNQNGEITALAPGQTDIIIQGFQQERRIPVVVHGKVAHFLVTPRVDQPVRLLVNTTREFSAIAQTGDSIPIEGVPMTWALSDSLVASFDANSGVLTARKGGTTTLSFVVRGFQPKVWNIEVMPGEVAFPNARATLRPREEVQLNPSFVDQRGNALAPATGLGWGTTDANIVKITPNGLITAVSPGRATISAVAAGGKPATMTVVVTGDLLVASNRGGSMGIWALTTDAPEQFHKVVGDGSNNIDPAYSPDRTKLAFASDRGGSMDLYVADADGSNPVRLTTDPAPEGGPAWTPDGSRIVFAATRAGSRQLYVISASGGEARQLTSLAGGASDAAVSPDGRTVAFTGTTSTSKDALTDIYSIPLQGGPPSAVTQSKDRRESHPAYLPDGTLVWLQTRKDKKDPDLVVQQPKIGGISATVLSSQQPITTVALSRDGERLAWIVSYQENSKATPELTLRWRAVTGGNETAVRLQAGERLSGPAF